MEKKFGTGFETRDKGRQVQPADRLASLLALGMTLENRPYRHESLLKPEAILDMRKLEKAMSQKDRPYWNSSELREAVGYSNDYPGNSHLTQLLDYLVDEKRIELHVDKYILTQRAQQRGQEESHNWGKHQRIGG
jgi:hypothetical protein